MVLKSHGEDAFVAGARTLRRHESSKRVWIASTSKCGAKFRNLSRLSSKVVPIVKDARGVGTSVLPVGAAPDTRSPESTHRMSKVSRGSLAWSLITPRKIG